jgi:hypothetical protein
LELPLLSRPGRTSLAALILNDGFEEVVEFFELSFLFLLAAEVLLGILQLNFEILNL